MAYLLLTSLTLLFLGLVLLWVRRDKLYLREATYWIVISLLILLGLFLARHQLHRFFQAEQLATGLFILATFVVLLFKSLLTDMSLTKLRRDIRRLNQQIAIMDAERHLRENQENDQP